MLTGLAFGRVKVQYILSPARSSLPFFFFADQRGLWTLWTAWLRVHKTPAHLLELTEGDKREATRERERERERGRWRRRSDAGVEYTALWRKGRKREETERGSHSSRLLKCLNFCSTYLLILTRERDGGGWRRSAGRVLPRCGTLLTAGQGQWLRRRLADDLYHRYQEWAKPPAPHQVKDVRRFSVRNGMTLGKRPARKHKELLRALGLDKTEILHRVIFSSHFQVNHTHPCSRKLQQ